MPDYYPIYPLGHAPTPALPLPLPLPLPPSEQVASVAGLASVHVVAHDTFHHNVPQFLQQHGELVCCRPLKRYALAPTPALALP